MRLVYKNLLLLAVSCIFTLGLGEIALRAYQSTLKPYFESDEYLGWVVKKNVHYELAKKDGCGELYHLTYQTDSLGFRKFGNTLTSKKKVLFIGDSFTQAQDASDDSTYYTLLSKWLNFEVFAYGTGGHGTLQEALRLEQIITQINPHLVVLQFCENDLINNCYELEQASIQHNNRHRRPYLDINDSLFYANPAINSTLSFIIEKSKLLSFIMGKIRNLLISKTNSKEIFNPVEYNKAKQITDKCLKKIKLICAKSRATFVSFTVNESLIGSKKTYQSLMRQNNIEILGDVPQAIANKEKQGECCLAEDKGHWNHTGHRICAESLMNRLQYVLTHEIKQ